MAKGACNKCHGKGIVHVAEEFEHAAEDCLWCEKCATCDGVGEMEIVMAKQPPPLPGSSLKPNRPTGSGVDVSRKSDPSVSAGKDMSTLPKPRLPLNRRLDASPSSPTVRVAAANAEPNPLRHFQDVTLPALKATTTADTSTAAQIKRRKSMAADMATVEDYLMKDELKKWLKEVVVSMRKRDVSAPPISPSTKHIDFKLVIADDLLFPKAGSGHILNERLSEVGKLLANWNANRGPTQESKSGDDTSIPERFVLFPPNEVTTANTLKFTNNNDTPNEGSEEDLMAYYLDVTQPSPSSEGLDLFVAVLPFVSTPHRVLDYATSHYHVLPAAPPAEKLKPAAAKERQAFFARRIPQKQEAVIRFLTKWMRANWGEVVSDATLLAKLTTFVATLKAMAEDPDEADGSRHFAYAVQLEETLRGQKMDAHSEGFVRNTRVKQASSQVWMEDVSSDGLRTIQELFGVCQHRHQINPTLFKFNAECLAAVLTRMESELYRQVSASLLTHLCVRKRVEINERLAISEQPCHALLAIFQMNTMIANWITSSIVLAKGDAHRADAINRAVQVAFHCRLMGNYSSAFSIVAGLMRDAVFKLANVWALLKRKQLQTLQDLARFFELDPTMGDGDWKRYLDEVKVSMAESRPMVPVVSLFMHRLQQSTVGIPVHKYNGDPSQIIRLKPYADVFRQMRVLEAHFQSSHQMYLTQKPSSAKLTRSRSASGASTPQTPTSESGSRPTSRSRRLSVIRSTKRSRQNSAVEIARLNAALTDSDTFDDDISYLSSRFLLATTLLKTTPVDQVFKQLHQCPYPIFFHPEYLDAFSELVKWTADEQDFYQQLREDVEMRGVETPSDAVPAQQQQQRTANVPTFIIS